jgi:hypothetical protein
VIPAPWAFIHRACPGAGPFELSSDRKHYGRRELALTKLIAKRLGDLSLRNSRRLFCVLQRLIDCFVLLRRSSGNLSDFFHETDCRLECIEGCLQGGGALGPSVWIVDCHGVFVVATMSHGFAVRHCKSLKRQRNACHILQHEIKHLKFKKCLILLATLAGFESA